MNEMEKNQLEEKEKEEIRRMVNEADAIYKFIQKSKLDATWMNDSERFMGFTFIHTKNLVKHSIILSKLTRWLIGLTITLVILSVVQIILIFTGCN